MSNFILSTSSTSDLPESYAQKHDLVVLPFSFIISGQEYKDDFNKSMACREFYDRLRSGEISKTSMINSQDFEVSFRAGLDAGRDILHIEFSSALSGSYQNAKTVADQLNQEYKDQKVIVIDSLSASLGLGLLIDYAVSLRDEGKDIDGVASWVEQNKLHMIHWFTVDDLNHLRRGGRVSGVTAFLGTMLHIKPVMDVDDLGRLIPHFKVRGRKKAIAALFQHMQQDIVNPEGQRVFISHGDCIDDANLLKQMILDGLPGIKDVLINSVGPVIGSHSGPGTLALFYMGKKRF